MKSFSRTHFIALLATAYPLDSTSTQSKPPSGSSSSGTDSTGTTKGCNAACQQLQYNSQLNGIWSGIGSSAISATSKTKRQTIAFPPLVCTDAELCASESTVLFCIDPNTYAFHDEFGGKGNVMSGTYVVPSALATAFGARVTAWGHCVVWCQHSYWNSWSEVDWRCSFEERCRVCYAICWWWCAGCIFNTAWSIMTLTALRKLDSFQF